MVNDILNIRNMEVNTEVISKDIGHPTDKIARHLLKN